MGTEVHETAIIHPKANISKGVRIGAYSIIGEYVTLGPHVEVANHCVIDGHTTIGASCKFFTGAVIGSIPQDKKYVASEKVFLEIGEKNIFREYVTVNFGTIKGGGKTVIGKNNLFMAYSHVAHDCVVGDNCVLANSGTLAGHVTLEDMAVIGGLTAVHQYVRLGRLSIVGGCSKVVQDIPPFSTCDGHPTRVFGLNAVGLKRADVSVERIKDLKAAFKILFNSGLTKTHALERLEKQLPKSPEIDHLVFFMKTSKRGVCR